LADFTSRLPKSAREVRGANLAVTSRYFLAVGSAKYGQALTRMEVLLDRKTVWPSIIWQKLL
ncbi:MAG: general secretion pathway protein GspK, partial [Rhodocyclaceae bacterium]